MKLHEELELRASHGNAPINVIVIVIFYQGIHSVKNTDFQWSPEYIP